MKSRIEKNRIAGFFPTVVMLSAKTGKNLRLLEEAIYNFVFQGKQPLPELMLVSNLRHIQSLREAQKLAAQAQALSLEERLSPELITQNLKDSCACLDKILGKDFSADLLDKIFKDFCIGK